MFAGTGVPFCQVRKMAILNWCFSRVVDEIYSKVSGNLTNDDIDKDVNANNPLR